jgi:hypothetical protein
MLWDANEHSRDFSRGYDETWVEKLYRGFARNLTRPFRFVCYTDWARDFREPIFEHVDPRMGSNGYGDCIRPFELNEPSIIVGLDTIVTGSIDHLADWCMTADKIALPNPYGKEACNGVVLCPAGKRAIFDEWRGENDMEWLRRQPHETIDAISPGHVVSYKAHVRGKGLGEARIVYFHGVPKPPEVKEAWVMEHWI